MTRAPTLYLTCGLPGSGKTTLAKRLEQDAPALRLTGDEWLHELFPGISTAEAETGPFRGRVERLQWPTAVRALELGCDVVLDWGVWGREERDVCRLGARDVGARVVLLLLDPPIDELWRRLSQRNADRPSGAFEITQAELLRWSDLFQRPTADELALYDPWEADILTPLRAYGGDDRLPLRGVDTSQGRRRHGGGGLPILMLLAGPLAGLVFAVGVTWLGSTRAGYSAVRQTVSELGALGGKGRLSLALLNLAVALSCLLFAWGLFSVARQSQVTAAPAYFVVSYALLAAGLAAFPSPHPLHNIVGLLQTIPFVGAPLSVALGWRTMGAVVGLSWAALVLLVVAMVLNLAPAFSRRLAKAFAPVYGLLQRSIFVTWYGWCAALGILLWLTNTSPK